jgi:hypothetical protein
MTLESVSLRGSDRTIVDNDVSALGSRQNAKREEPENRESAMAARFNRGWLSKQFNGQLEGQCFFLTAPFIERPMAVATFCRRYAAQQHAGMPSLRWISF